ncbi:MAG: tRNA 2-thiocytidine(32) synthetase TtcA [Lachnospiraceae bacterium]|nr:tRNA 2-thiocytidine(32) synthetase TtcA [Lachnospiraceae bacterium]
MKIQQIYSKTRQAIDNYKMIQSGDKIAVGVSGGKDSITLLHSLTGLKHFYPATFELVAICVNLGFENQDFSGIENACKTLDVPVHFVKTQISDIVFRVRQESNPCALCAKMRKGALNQAALELGCNKVAYGHHRDDVVETMMLSLIYEGRFHTFSPVTYLDNTGLTVIRPFIYLKEADIQGFINKNNITIFKNKCPADGYTKRQYMKELLKEINSETKDVKDRLFSAIENGDIPGWQK